MNLEEVARVAGVSRSTVSRVVNKDVNVRESTREKVLAVIDKLGYTPNPAARALVTQKSRTFGVIIPYELSVLFGNSLYFPTLLKGISESANSLDYGMMLLIGSDEEGQQRYTQRIIRNRMLDGMILVSPSSDSPLIDELLNAGILFVTSDRVEEHVDRISYITVENTQSSYEAVSHLIKLGRKRIGTLTGQWSISDTRDRTQGYYKALEEHGLPINEDYIMHGHFSYPSGYRDAMTLVERGVDAIFAHSDDIAYGAVAVMNENGVRVPDDVAVVGFDDLGILGNHGLRLTTVRQPIRQKGERLGHLLIDLINDKVKHPIHEYLPAKLIVRDTCGGVPTEEEE